jgi:hypothetical protein
LEAVVITGLQHSLIQPDLVATFIAEFHPEVNRYRGDAEQEWRGLGKRLAGGREAARRPGHGDLAGPALVEPAAALHEASH